MKGSLLQQKGEAASQIDSAQVFPSVSSLCNDYHPPASKKWDVKWDVNWNVTPPPPPDSPVTFSRQMRAGLVIRLWDSTLLMLFSLFFFPLSPPPPLSVVLKAVWLCLHEPRPYAFQSVRPSSHTTITNRISLEKEEMTATYEAANPLFGFY